MFDDLSKNIWRYRIKPYIIPGLIIIVILLILSLLNFN